MSILNNILKTFVGDKTKKDLVKLLHWFLKLRLLKKELESFS